MKPKLTLADAKEMSRTKWRGIKADLPNVKLDSGGQPDEAAYGKCGFCLYYDEDCEKEGQKCVLYPNHCTRIRNSTPHLFPLYWQICDKLGKGEDTSKEIDEMIATIEAVEVVCQGKSYPH